MTDERDDIEEELEEEESGEDWQELVLEGFEEEEEREPRERYFVTEEQVERVILVGVSQPPTQMPFETDEHLEELEMLADTAGAETVGKVYQSRKSISSSFFIGKGKVQMVKELCEDEGVHTVIFDDDLSPRQQRNLEEALGTKVVDRTALILDIFALHAQTMEAKTQVELAQLEYLLPRLSGMWTHLSKQYGGIGTKGPGETQIETDRRLVRDRISHLKSKLDTIHKQRMTQRKSRQDVTKVALVGYTNVGKSTLLNILTDAGVLAENKLFATLDSTVRAYDLEGRTLLLTDTVGFIRKLPTKLVASFKSTLLEVTDADIILHVVDCTHPTFEHQVSVVNDTLKELDAGDKPTVLVFNKVDALESDGALRALKTKYPNSVFISAKRGMNLGELQSALQEILDEAITRVDVIIAPPDFKLVAEFHSNATVLEERYEDNSVHISAEIEPEVLSRLQKRYPDSLTVE